MTETNDRPKRGRPRTIDNDQVLDVAMRAYWHKDPADVSVNYISRLAGVSKPTLYRAFGNEDGLMRAALDRYADSVLMDIVAILNSGTGLQRTLEALIDFACDDPRMQPGCLFTKMRTRREQLGPKTRARIEEMNAGAYDVYGAFLQSCYEKGDWPEGVSVDVGAKYLQEQFALIVTMRTLGESPTRVRKMMKLALSVFTRDLADTESASDQAGQAENKSS